MSTATFNQAVSSDLWVQKLPDLQFFQSDTITLPFQFVDGNKEPIDLRTCDVYWFCSPYGKFDEPELVLSSTQYNDDGFPEIRIDDDNPSICYVNLYHGKIGNLKAQKYKHQPVLIYRSLVKGTSVERRFLRAEGDIIFRRYINDSLNIHL